MSDHLVLIVDDEFAIRRLLRVTLEREGYRVAEAADARAALALATADRPDAVLLDLGLPDRDGLELVPILKRDGGPAVIVVSAREATDEKVAALDLGADDYVTKPFDSVELLARLRAALRHRLADRGARPRIVAGDLVVDLEQRVVLRGDTGIHLTRKEQEVLTILATSPGRVITHQRILAAAWPRDVDPAIEKLRLVIRNLRQKIEADPAAPRLIVNELGVGYRFVTE